MNFYFDESGDFRVPDDRGQHAVGIVSGIVIPDCAESEVFKRFDAFVGTLPSHSFHKGEPKGKLLDEDSRRAFATMFFNLPHILFCPIMMDLT